MFRSRIRAEAGCADQTRHRRAVDNGAAGPHNSQLRTQAMQYAVDVDVHHEAPLFKILLCNIRGHRDHAGQVGGSVEPAERGDSRGDPGFDLVVLSHIDLVDKNLNAAVRSLEVFLERLEGLPLYIGQGKLGAPAGEEASTFQSNSRCGTGEGYGFAFEMRGGHRDFFLNYILPTFVHSGSS